MLKRIVVCFVAVLLGFVTTGCATGGYLGTNPYPGPLGRVMAGNLALTCPGDVFVGGVNRCLGDLGGNIGRYMGYPMYYGGYGGTQLSENDKLSVFCGLGGAGVAMLAKAGLGRTIGAGFVSAAACQVATFTMSHRQQQTIYQGGSPQAVRYAPDGMPIAVGRSVEQAPPAYGGGQSSTRPAGPKEIEPTCPSGQVMFRNDTGADVTVSADGVSPFVMMAGGQSCRDWVAGLRWNAKKHSTMATEVVGEAHSSSAVMNFTPICFEGDGRGVIHLRNTCH